MNNEAALQTIRNFITMGENIGTAGQPGREQFPLIAASGYQTVINLAMPEHPDALADESSIVTELGMDYIHIPVPFDAPTPEHLRSFFDSMDTFAGKKVFIHCIMNYRVAVFLYLYLKHRLGYDDSKSRSPMFDQWQPNPIWEDVMQWRSPCD